MAVCDVSLEMLTTITSGVMMAYGAKYYCRENGDCEVREWLAGLSDAKLKANLYALITTLVQEGLILLQTKAMVTISGDDAELYELKKGQGRITVYRDTLNEVYVLLNGFLKRNRTEPGEIDTARVLLNEYLSGKGELV